jgi:hypothetical protein
VSTPANTTTARMTRVERLAAELRQRLDQSQQVVTEHDAEVAAIRDRYALRLREAAAVISAARTTLEGAIRSTRDIWLAPNRKTKTDVLHGIRCGFKKGRAKWVMPDGDLVELVRQHLPADRAEQLVQNVETVDPAKLSDGERKAIGAVFVPGAEQIVCTEQRSTIERALAALLEHLDRTEVGDAQA